ncbi:MAG: hypothetical protein IJU40_09080 [Desulfovibrionaceae bacterium]|nr:hypothetical protein [Desulfovibrionaceae bacterium]
METETGEIKKGNIGQNENKGKTESKIEENEIEKKIKSIELNPLKDNILPNLNKETLKNYGLKDKPVKLKKSTIERNAKQHPDVPVEKSKNLIGQALYNPIHVVIGNEEKPYLNFIGIDEEKRGVVLLDIEDKNENFEIVHWHKIELRGEKKLLRKAEKIEQAKKNKKSQ